MSTIAPSPPLIAWLEHLQTRKDDPMLVGLVLLFVGAVLFLNGAWMLGRIADREIILINVLVGIILNRRIQFATAWVTLLSGILTGWLPAMLLLNGVS